jgi:hypothetical protein
VVAVSAFTDEFGEYLLEVVQFAPRTTTDADRVQAYGAAVSVDAYIERFPRMVRDATGRDVLSHATIIIDITPTVEPTAQVTMPDSSQPLILNVARYGQLIPHQEVFV